ncbi:MAG: TlpA family protein disulfide reductase [Ignavibacteria bacterium]|nr:TlpA family protein disulfide reductase [Ignavibacteria bacterium]
MLYKYVPTQEEYTLVYLNPLTGVENSSAVKISNDGSFTADITVYSPTLIVLTDKKILNIPIWVAPNQESRMWVNLPEIYRSGSKLLRNKQSNGKQVYYSGYLSELSADLSRDDISKPAKEDHSSKIIDMNQKQYIDFTLAKYNETIEYNNNLKISPLAKKIANYEQVLRLTSILNNVDYTVANAYSKKHNVSIREALKVIMLEKNEDDNDFYKLMPFDDPDILLVSYISQYIQILGYSQPNSSDPYATIRHLAENNEVLPEERELIKQYILSMENNQIIENHSEMIEVLNKYRSLSEKYMNNQRGANYLAKFWDKDQAFLLDLIKTQKICKSIQEYNPISDSEKPEILKLHPVLSELIYEQNEEILARIEENKNKSGFEIIDPPANVDEELFSELIKPFKGKVILVDLWGTWCAPCRMAHVEMDPMKASFEGKDVVFLYIAGENSPKNTWENMISGIQGSHYRLKETQWNFLNDMLKVSGVPTYIILDKEGKQTFYHTGFPGVDIIKRELNKLL